MGGLGNNEVERVSVGCCVETGGPDINDVLGIDRGGGY
jgi:hypothetical protein